MVGEADEADEADEKTGTTSQIWLIRWLTSFNTSTDSEPGSPKVIPSLPFKRIIKTMSSRLVINLLGYLGLAPFLAAAWSIVTGHVFFNLEPRLIFISYSAIILAFLSGALWGRGLTVANTLRRNLLLILSNGFALLAWFNLMAGDRMFGLSVSGLAIGYLLLQVAESRLASSATLRVEWPYSKMRLILTTLVVTAHVVIIFSL